MKQKIEIIGRLGHDPEMRYTPQGQNVTSFSVAADHQYKNNAGEKVKITAWFKINAWGKLGEICNQYLHKGSLVYLEGRLTPDPATGGPRVWTSKDGKVGASYEIILAEIKFLSKNENSEAGQRSDADQAQSYGEESQVPENDDIPF